MIIKNYNLEIICTPTVRETSGIDEKNIHFPLEEPKSKIKTVIFPGTLKMHDSENARVENAQHLR